MTFGCTSLAASEFGDCLQKNIPLTDFSGNGYHGVYVGAFQAVPGATNGDDNDANLGAYLDGTIDAFAVVPDAAALRITTQLGIFSLEFWLRMPSFVADGGTTQRIWCKNEDVNNQWAVNIQQNGSNGRLGIGVDYAGVTYSVTANAGAVDLTPGVWHHCVITMNATTPLLYVNGVLVATTGTSQGIGAGANMLFGRLAQNSSTGRLIGSIDEAAIYPDILTPLEILRHYAASDGEVKNLIVRSQEFDTTWTNIRSQDTANATTAPNGSATADKVFDDNTVTNTHYIFMNNVVVAAGEIYTYSVYAKAAERDDFRIQIQEGAASANGFRFDFDLLNVTCTQRADFGEGRGHSGSITSVGNGWYRCVVTGIIDATSTTMDCLQILMTNPNTITYSGDNVSGLYLWGAQLQLGNVATKYIPTVAAAVQLLPYNQEILVDLPTAYYRFGEGTPRELDGWPQRPIRVEVNGASLRSQTQVNSLTIDDTLGEQASCSFTLVNPDVDPTLGEVVRVLYYDELIFGGTLDNIRKSINNTGTVRTFNCTCVDFTQFLTKRFIKRNFVDYNVITIMDSVLDNELSDEGLSIGTVDNGSLALPLVDSSGTSALEFLRDLAGATGHSLIVTYDKQIQFLATSNPLSPITIDTTTAEEAGWQTDRQTYRNVQVVEVTGTPSDESAEPALKTEATSQNDEQIAARAAIEGNSGRYESYEKITHPISNVQEDLELLALNYAELLLGTAGVVRQTLTARVRRYGMRAGQFATVDLASLGLSGDWLIKKVSITEERGRDLIHKLELVLSTTEQRAFESWIKILQTGKTTIQALSLAPHSSESFTTAGVDQFIVPALVTRLTFTCKGGSGGGGGGAVYIPSKGAGSYHYGGNGGASGKAIASLDVVEGDVIDLVIGAAGAAGVSDFMGPGASVFGGDFTQSGTSGGDTTVYRNGILVCAAYKGTLGTRANWSGSSHYNGSDGSSGSGSGAIVTVGGGFSGGARGFGDGTEPTAGHAGSILIEY